MKPIRPHDFEGWIRFLREDEGGRKLPPVVGFRPDFKYRDQIEPSLWCVWPLELFTDIGDVPEGTIAPTQCFGRFWILSEELAQTYHKYKLRIGVEFMLYSGWHLIGEGSVTKLNMNTAIPPVE